MLIKSYKKSNCVKGCILFNDDSKYLYWENKNTTTDELEIVKYLNNITTYKNPNILHVGIGNSYIAHNTINYNKIDGITISGNEFDYANSLNIKNYNVFFLNKFTNNGFSQKKLSNYDIIIDVNLKSFSCCEFAFNDLITNYTKMLKHEGIIISGKRGMNWSRYIKPVISFSFKKLFYKRLKEYNGPQRNILKIQNCLDLCQKHNLKFFELEDSSIVYFKKLN